MSRDQRSVFTGALLGLALWARAVAAAEVVIDPFTSAVTTVFVANTNVAQSIVGSTTVTDTGLPDVLGGVRQLTVEAQSLLNVPVPDLIVSGVFPLAGFLEYDSTTTGDGKISLLYDRTGAGLHVSLSGALGLRVVILDADPASVPYDVAVTLTDSAANSATVSQTMFVPGGPMTLLFPFSGFPGVDPGRLFSIQLTIDPNVAGDMRIDAIETYGTPVTIPTLSPSMVMAMIAGMALLLGWRTRGRALVRRRGR